LVVKQTILYTTKKHKGKGKGKGEKILEKRVDP
jgi:hypothetical protein